MPLYEYKCDACGRRFEVIRKFSDPALDACTLCGSGPVNRLPSSPAIQFKGSGFYITDYGKKGEADRGKGEGGRSDKVSTEKAQDAKSDAAAAERGTEKGGGATAATESKTDTATKSDAPAKSEGAPKPSSPAPTPSSGSKD